MKKLLFAAVMLSFAIAPSVYAQAGDGWLSRYWDGCKPSCSWSGKPSNNQGQCKECDKNNNKINTSDANRSSCDGGNSYTCWDMSPWSISNTEAYGFAAAHRDNQCGTCWELTFKGGSNGNSTNASSLNGKKLTVMISNIGGDVNGNQLDFLVPGGGVGMFDSFSGQLGVNKSDLGAQYGGLVSDGCMGNPTCLKGKCDKVFGASGREWLKAGCYFYADFMGAVDNPTYNAKEVPCPAALSDRWKNAATGTPGGTPGGNPTPTTYTLQVSRNPSNGGTTTPAASQSGIAAGTQYSITATPASGYTFVNWTGGMFANANSATTTVTVNANTTITANFQASSNPQPTTYTLTMARNPTAGGTTTPQATQTGITANQQVSISATAASGYAFNGWVVTSGSANIVNTNNASTQVTLTSNATITANFRSTTTGGATYSLTVNRNPTAGGSTNPTGTTSNIAAGTQVQITATPAQGYTFVNWTGGTFASATSATTTVTVNASTTVVANFQQQTTGGGGCTVPSNRTQAIRVEAEDYDSYVGGNMQTNTENGITVIGYIEDGYSTTYNKVNAPQAGSYSMQFKLATEMNPSTFTVRVNNANVGSISLPNTGSWSTYQVVTLCNGNSAVNVPLNAGNNTVVLAFGNAVNVDYFEFFGEPSTVTPPAATYTLTVNRNIAEGGTTSPSASATVEAGTVNISADPAEGYTFVNWTGGTFANAYSATTTVTVNANTTITANFQKNAVGVSYNAARARARTRVAVIPGPRGFTAAMPLGHSYTSYSLVDLRGREIRSGKIPAGATDLRFDGLNRSVMFLRLSGSGSESKKGGGMTVLRAVSY